jgi:hypothetical protein
MAAAPKVFQFKLVLLGDSAVGKSSLVLRFVRGQFFEYQESTIGGMYARPSAPLLLLPVRAGARPAGVLLLTGVREGGDRAIAARRALPRASARGSGRGWDSGEGRSYHVSRTEARAAGALSRAAGVVGEKERLATRKDEERETGGRATTHARTGGRAFGV